MKHIFRVFMLVGVLVGFLLSGMAQQAKNDNWQQEADYKIEVTLNDTLNQLDAFITIDYTNNSPQTLDFIYLHLWPNAYRNQSTELAKQMLENGKTAFWYSKESQRGYIDSLNFKVNAEVCKWQYSIASGEICKVFLNEPLKTGGHVRISTPFRVKLPETFSRMGHIGQSYQITQWYPKPAVYDKYGWHPIPYLDQGEFYSEFGSFDVAITLPQNYVVGATGDLQDTSEISWMNQKARADSAVTGWSGLTDLKFPPSAKETKTLHYKQTNIHDFGWFADKRWHVLKGEVELPHSKGKVTTWALFTNNQAKLWAKAPGYLHDAIYYYSLWVGDYPYKQVTAVDGTISAGSGMEYPNVTVIGEEGSGFTLDDVITHEVGHNWFYGMLGSNERDHAWMDEGINSFYEARYIRMKYPNEKMLAGVIPAVTRFLDAGQYKHSYLIDLGYQFMARENLDQPIELTSADFTEFNYGAIVYGKTPLIFNYLEAYLGTDEFDLIMKKYFETWKYHHPQPEDVRQIFEQGTGKNLSWFFDDLMKTTKKLDYKITDVKEMGKEKQTGAIDSLQVQIKNVNKVASPVTISLMRKDSVIYSKWVEGFKGKDTVMLPKLNADRVQIDPDLLMPEVDRRNNTYIINKIAHKFERLKFQFAAAIENQNRSQVLFAPYLGWNNYDKTQVGVAFYSPFFPSRRFEYVLSPAIGTGSKQFIGFGRANYNFFTQKVRKITLGVKAKRFSYLLFPKDLTLNKIEPYLHFDLNKKTARSPVSQSINLRSALVMEQWINPFDSSDLANNTRSTQFYYVNEATYRVERNTTLHPLDFNLTLQQGTQFIELFAEAHFKVSYKLKNQGMFIRIFAGGYPYYARSNSDVTTAPLPNMYLSNSTPYNYLYPSGNAYWLQKDYMFDENFVDRNGQDRYFGRQVAISGGGFRSLTGAFGATNKFLSSANITSTIYRWVPIRPFASVAVMDDETNKLRAAAEIGLSLVAIKDVIEINLPLATTNLITQSQQAIGITKWYQRITFTLKLPVLRVGDLIRQFAGF